MVATIGISPSKIIVAGESAGANLACTLLLTLKSQSNREQQEESLLPAGAALLSPYVDLTINQASFAINERNDILCSKHIAKYVPYYIPNFYNLDDESKLSMMRNPLISPLHADFSGTTCPIFLAYGENELLRTSIERFIANLEGAGCNLTTLRGEKAGHVWLAYSVLAASKQIYERDCKQFIDWMASICDKLIK